MIQFEVKVRPHNKQSKITVLHFAIFSVYQVGVMTSISRICSANLTMNPVPLKSHQRTEQFNKFPTTRYFITDNCTKQLLILVY